MARSRPCSHDGNGVLSGIDNPGPRSPPPAPLRSAMKHGHSNSTSSIPPISSPLSSPPPSTTTSILAPSSTSSAPPSTGVTVPGIHFADKTSGDPLPSEVPSATSSTLLPGGPTAVLTSSPSSSFDASATPVGEGSSSLQTTGSSNSPRPSFQSSSTSVRPALHPRRISAEMPPGYARKVGFSTLDTEEGTTGGGIGAEFSFTVQAKSEGFASSSASRCFLVASDGASYSVSALDWLVATLVEDGDEIVVLRVIEGKDCPVGTREGDYEDQMRAEADDVLLHVLNRNDRKISVSVEFVIGPIIKTIQRMLEVYRPDSLVVGTRGRSESAWKKAFLGSTSQWLVAKSPVPVIVVRPERKVRKSVEARMADPKRHSYRTLLAHGEGNGIPVSRSRSRASSSDRAGRLSVDFGRKAGTKELRREKTTPA